MLPTSRDLNSILLMAPGVHPTGPAGAFSFGGSVTFENLFLLNGVSINENIRGQAFDTAIEDAIKKTTVANGGVSAEFGRFSGGVVNIVTKSGGNRFSGSFRESLNNDKWRTLSPFETERIATNPEPRIDNVVPTYEYTLGGPVMRDRLWFFTSGRLRDESQGRTLIATTVPYQFREEQRRYEAKGTFSLNPQHRFQVNYNHHDRAQINHSFNQNLTMDLRSLGTRLPERLYAGTYSGMLTSKLFVEALVSKRTLKFIGSGAKSTNLIEGTLLIDAAATGGARWWCNTFCGVCTPEGGITRTSSSRAHTSCRRRVRIAQPRVRLRQFQRHPYQANNHQSGSDYRILSAGAILTGAGAGENDIFPSSSETVPRRFSGTQSSQETEGTSFRTHSGFVNDTWRVGESPHGQPGDPLRQEPPESTIGQRRRQGQRLESAARPHLGSDRHRPVERDGQRGEVRRGDPQPCRRFVGGRRQPARPGNSSIAAPHQRPGHDDAGPYGAAIRRSSTGFSKTAARAAAQRRADHPRRHAASPTG